MQLDLQFSGYMLFNSAVPVVLIFLHAVLDPAGLPVPAREQNHPPGLEAGQHFPQRPDGDQVGGFWPGHQVGLRWREEANALRHTQLHSTRGNT